MDTTASITLSPIGRALPRVDGPLKVSGTATYTADHHFPGLLFAVPVPATITSANVDRSTFPSPEPCPECARFIHARTWAGIFGSYRCLILRR
jgi:xanthine dehydrogenase YagR molybdenum-binding subunit